MDYTIGQIATIIQGELISSSANSYVRQLAYDSRLIINAEGVLFFAISTSDRDGHQYITDAYDKGVRNFVVSNEPPHASITESNFIIVQDVLAALQQLAAYHRRQFQLPVIGITGSNGKTIVKEWLYQLLHHDYNMVRSPASYNSQIGVPYSVWQLSASHTLGIFEAGISSVGEMEKLQPIIQPSIGILTNIGEAHDAGFASRKEKLHEKLKLFSTSEILICCREYVAGMWEDSAISGNTTLLTWSFLEGADVHVTIVRSSKTETVLVARYKDTSYHLSLYFTDQASIENVIHCWCVLMHLGYDDAVIQERFKEIHKIDMRLQLLHGINNCMLINDSYSADLTSLQIALQFLNQQAAGLNKSVIISDFFGTGKQDRTLYQQIFNMIILAGVQKVRAIGPRISAHLSGHTYPQLDCTTYTDTSGFICQFRAADYSHEIILLKGARVFGFEQIAALLEIKKHQTVLKINLNALAYNLKQYRKLVHSDVRMMAMVKAFSYGSGASEIAGVLQYNHVDFLGVAYADEGADLVRSGIAIPVMVMNTDEASFSSIVRYGLQPVMYSPSILQKFVMFLQGQGITDYPVHLEVDTGMNRLGLQEHQISMACKALQQSKEIRLISVFSHLAASEEPAQDEFTSLQIKKFLQATDRIDASISYGYLKHIANSAAVIRHPQSHLDMVRIGIGMYGVETDEGETLQLQPVASLLSTIAQVRHLSPGDTVSYNRKGVVQGEAIIATVRIGYADGYSRRFGNGVGKMLVNGRLAPVIGSVCMDMTMIDITGIPDVSEGTEVVVFGEGLDVKTLAAWSDTIPYEILTSVSQRVKRVYYRE